MKRGVRLSKSYDLNWPFSQSADVGRDVSR